jgi:tetrahydromethanopterin S-methyltransferase subunit C
MVFCHSKIWCSFCTTPARLWRLNNIHIFQKKKEEEGVEMVVVQVVPALDLAPVVAPVAMLVVEAMEEEVVAAVQVAAVALVLEKAMAKVTMVAALALVVLQVEVVHEFTLT